MDTKEDVSSSIPHMHLFMYLKRKFPTLKDADITDVIQRFGLDKVRCEIELTRKNEEDHRGYHSPWNRSRTSSSRGSTSSRNSPLSPSDTHSYSTSSPPLQNGNSPSPPLSNASQSSVNNCFKIDDDDDHFNQRSNIPTSDDQLSNRTLNFSPYSSPIKTNTNTTDIGQWGHSSQRVTDSGFDVSVTDYEELENKDSNMNSADPVSSPPKSEANISSSAPSNNENSQRDHQLSQQSQQTQQSQQQPIPGTRHITSLHFIPSLPHDAHHTPVPPSSHSDTVSIGGRSYTSVNLQLRQPSFIAQPPINIRGSGSSLSYSTSSLDHKHGSRSSLHISIGPTGGSISAMRTNLRTNNQSDTAFQIHYSNEKDETIPSCSTTYSSMYGKENNILDSPSVVQGTSQTFQPNRRQYRNYISNLPKSGEYVPSPKPRKISLPETTGPPPHPIQSIHYYPTSSHVFDNEYPFHPPLRQAHQATTEWNIDPLLVEAAIQEQILRKTRLEEELSLRIGEKRKLETEVKNLGEELQIRETNQRLEVARNKKEIEVIQQENSKLQSACDEMEREILESGESPKTDEEGRGAQRLRFPSSPNNYSGTVTPVQDNSLRSFSQQVLPRANSTSSLSSGRVVSPLSPLAPSRKAPSPPVISPISSAPDPASRNVEQVAQRPATIGSDENRREWACRKCTFINSRYLNECEICGFHHVSVGTPTQNLPPQTQAPSPGGPCYCHHRRHYSQGQDHRNAGELQDIHIQVRHHNLP